MVVCSKKEIYIPSNPKVKITKKQIEKKYYLLDKNLNTNKIFYNHFIFHFRNTTNNYFNVLLYYNEPIEEENEKEEKEKNKKKRSKSSKKEIYIPSNPKVKITKKQIEKKYYFYLYIFPLLLLFYFLIHYFLHYFFQYKKCLYY